MFKPNWLIATAVILSGALAARTLSPQNTLVSETRTKGHHTAFRSDLQQTTLPPLLSYVPTYYKDVQAILDKNCLGCHIEGGIAPFSLEKPADAVRYA